ncbi:hypothetical protein [Hymenobacter profundi]|uniref:Photosynthesis system II assembly factor Ycf48/Hcf136-like domain-containing protein n=1 Tax=Hymenobacter profundi TaxID=1982110 RepID=A0ABS6X539_9BACT|nr:hypothetical protein [Hymenobacter profundi]MBW3130436.1 hypothetical protein [Hymenobacter profundi]
MKALLVSGVVLVSLVACQKDKEDEVQPEPTYADWYAIKSPDAYAIEAVTGDIDGTLVIVTSRQVYQTKDRGKTWRTSNYNSNIGLFGLAQAQDTLLLLDTQTHRGDTPFILASNPSYFSLDKGLTWQRYRNWRYDSHQPQVARNQAMSLSGSSYEIDVLQTPVAGSWVETVGVVSTTGRKLALPQSHQIKSLYFDTKSRLYVAASAPICGQREKFAFCGEENGILYVSKEPQP